MSERRRPFRRPLRRREIPVQFPQPALREPHLQQFEAAGDAGQQVVEVVRQPARELPDRLHLLRLPQRLLGLPQRLGLLLLGGDVAPVRVHQVTLDRGAPRDPSRLAVPAAEAVLEIRQVGARRRGIQALLRHLGVRRPHEIPEAVADRLLRPMAKDRGPGRIDGAEHPIGTDHDQQIARVPPHPVAFGRPLRHPLLQIGVQRRQGLGRNPLLLNIGIRAHPLRDRAFGRSDRLRPDQVPAIRPVGAADAEFDFVRIAGRQCPPPDDRSPPNIARMDDAGPAVAGQGVEFPPAIGKNLLVEPVQATVRPRCPGMVRHRLRQRAELRFTGTQRLLGPPGAGHIAIEHRQPVA